ncbi:MAG: FHA domain-containing protein [Persicimonas sp.]
MGRASECTIRSNRKSVSRHHAEFRYTNGVFEVVDLNSSNGTWLIDQEQRFEISHERLEDQDEIWCGDFIIHFLLEESGRAGATVNEPAPIDGAEQQYVPGPTEAGEPLGFGAEVSESYQQGSASVGMAEPSASIYEYEEVEELDDGDLVEIDAQPVAGGGGDIERLRAEKQSIEDLASRQAFEIEEMRVKLEQATDQLEQANARGSNAEQLQANLQQAQARLEQLEQENRQLRDELDAGGGQHEQLEALSAELESERRQVGELRDELQRMEDELAGARHRLDSVREHESELERDLERRDERIEALEHDVRTLQSELDSASSSGSQVESLREKLDETRIELDKSDRLLGEYERRNADLKSEIEAERDSARDNEAKLAELFDARDHLERQVEELEEQLEPTQQQLEEKTSELEEAEAELGDLRAEVQGLKQRLQLERRRTKEDAGDEDAEQLEADLVEATERIAELEAERDELVDRLEDPGDQHAQPDPSDQRGVDAEVLADIRQRLSALARLTDAIERTDLEPLSTVDRIRLQSAIRETEPKETLQQAIELLDE